MGVALLMGIAAFLPALGKTRRPRDDLDGVGATSA
jgi:hypothetical protein